MPRTRLLDTTTFRLTAVYFGLFSLSALALVVAVNALSQRFVDGQVRDAIATDAFSLQRQFELQGFAGLRQTIKGRVGLPSDPNLVYVLYDKTRARSEVGNLPGLPALPEAGDDPFVRLELAAGGPGERGRRSHEVLGMHVPIGERHLLFVGRDVEEKAATLRLIRAASGIGTGIMLVLGLGVGYLMSRWTLRRLDVVNRTTARIMAGDLGRRIAVRDGGGDEFDELARNVNSMLDRIERLLAGMRQVTDDIAHDLRTPLNRLRSRIEVALMRDLDQRAARELLEATIRDADGLIETFNALLSIARAEAGGGHRHEWEPIDLSGLVDELFELYEPLAEEKGVTLVADTSARAEVVGNRQLVAQAVANLADNAIKYAPPGGRVALRTAAHPAPRVEVVDDGPGIPPGERERAKQRFVRLDATRSTPGSGLGLSLVDAVARLHDARLELLDNAPGPGLKVSLTFPARPQAAPERPRGPERAPAYIGPPATADGAAD